EVSPSIWTYDGRPVYSARQSSVTLSRESADHASAVRRSGAWSAGRFAGGVMEQKSTHRRGFLQGMLSAGALAAAAPVGAQAQSTGEFSYLPQYARAQHYKSLKQSSYDR